MTPVERVGHLTEEHIGWQIKVADENPTIRHRTFVLGGIRTWTYKDKTTVGLLDTSDADRRIKGTERGYPPETPCAVLRQIKKPRRRGA